MSASHVPTGNTYDKLASTNPIEQRMMAGFLAALDEMLDVAAGVEPSRILEVGVGEGHVMRRVRNRFRSAALAGVDLPDADLADDWRTDSLPCLFGDATKLPFPDASFDLVLAIEVLEHVPHPARALVDLHRVCRPGGVLIASVPLEPIWRIGNLARRRYVSDWGNTPGHVNHWGRGGFRRFVGTAFDVERVASPVPWTMVLARR
jgi:ubiquinone/menaquinone biosynthesis C-methylase UbiE